MKKIILSIFIASWVGFTATAQTQLFIDPEFSKHGHQHQILAVIPFKTSITLRPKQMAGLKEGQLENMEQNESLNIQQSMYSWFLKRKQAGDMWVNIQDVSTTNALLAKKDVTYENIEEFTPVEIAEILEVDAIIKGTFDTNKPMSDGASMALGLVVGFYGSTNLATINMFVHDAKDGKVLVNYYKGVAGSVGSSTDQLINKVMRKASRRIPYTKPKE
ncbi:MAG: hypothetical protein RIF33_23035 [Cyclobacteriaceae bacterium]